MTLDTWLEDWLLLHCVDLKPRTRESYADLIRRFVSPALGQIPVEDLTAADVRHLLAQICAAGHTRTAELVFVMLKAALDELPESVMRSIRRPKHVQTSPKPWSDGEMSHYRRACDAHSHGLALLLGLVLGLRRGEICGARWSDIDWDAEEIHICNQRIRLADGRLIDAPPKSRTSDRTIPIPAPLMARLRKERQLSGYICRLSPSGIDAAHRALVRRLGLPPIPLHGLRHSMATACIRHGGDMRSLQLLLGHASFSTTANRYTHPDREMMAQAIDAAADACYTVLHA